MVIGRIIASIFALCLVTAGAARANDIDLEEQSPHNITYPVFPPAPAMQTPDQAQAKTTGCMSCHTETDSVTMHTSAGVNLGCTDCHGGDAAVTRAAVVAPGSAQYKSLEAQAHVEPRYPEAWSWPSSAKPVESYTLLNKEAPEFIRFENPSDYRVAREACGACHLGIIQAAERSLMATGAHFWAAGAYNNGILPFKHAILGEAYTRDGKPASEMAPVKPTPEMTHDHGIIAQIYPLPSWEIMPPADIFRVFERGGRNISSEFPEIGLPDSNGELQRIEEPGRPDIRQSNRGPASGLRVSIPILNITKTRLNDPYTWFMGTNDNPGDYRNSGCASCHVVYANNRDIEASGPYAKFGNHGMSQSIDPTIPKDEPAHPLRHVMTNAIPTEQCMICHMHQPNLFMNTWDPLESTCRHASLSIL